MPEVLEQPPTKTVPGIPFNPATASAAGQRSGQVRRQHAALLAGKPFNLPVLPPVDQVERTTKAQLDLVSNQIKRTRDVLNDDDYRFCKECERGGIEPHHRAQLLKALDTLLDRQRVLLGIPLPGSRRPSSDKQERRRILDLAPVGIAGQIVDVATVQVAQVRTYMGEYDDPPGIERAPQNETPAAPPTVIP